jgi:hypothetical protein
MSRKIDAASSGAESRPCDLRSRLPGRQRDEPHGLPEQRRRPPRRIRPILLSGALLEDQIPTPVQNGCGFPSFPPRLRRNRFGGSPVTALVPDVRETARALKVGA